MTDNKKVLHNLLRASQMGQSGITAVLPMARGPALRQVLKQQRKEYASIEKDIQSLAQRMEYSFPPNFGIVDTLSAMSAKGQLLFGDRDSKIAGMMIQGNTRGAIQTTRDLHCAGLNGTVAALAQKILDTEQNNIHQMEKYL